MPVATAQTKLTVEDKQLQAGLRKSISAIKQYGQKVKKTMLAVSKGVLAVSAAAGAIAWNFIKAASDFEEVRGKFAAVFKDLTGEATDFVDELSKSLGRSRTDLTSFMATLQDTFVPLGFARREGLKMSKTLVKLAIDLASFNNQAESDVIRDLQSAIVGNHETMRKYGVIITQATLDQELLKKGFRGGAKDASEQEKALARLNIILGGTTDAQGDAERTSGSFANQMRALKAATEDLRVELGNELLPLAKDLVAFFKDMTTGSENWLKPAKENSLIMASFVNTLRLMALNTPFARWVSDADSLNAAILKLQENSKLLGATFFDEVKRADPLQAMLVRQEKANEKLDKEQEKRKARVNEQLAELDSWYAAFTGKAEEPIQLAQADLTTPVEPLERKLLVRTFFDEDDKPEKDMEMALKPRFEGLEQAWERITSEAASVERDAADKTADNTDEIEKDTKKIKTSNEKIEGFMGQTVALLTSVDGKIGLTTATFAE